MPEDNSRLPLAQDAARDSFDHLPKKDRYAARYLAKALDRGVMHDPGIQAAWARRSAEREEAENGGADV